MPDMTFGQLLRKHRKDAGLSLREFSKQAGIDPSNISRIENGKQKPPRKEDHILNFQKVLNLPNSEDNALLLLSQLENKIIPECLLEEVRQKVNEIIEICRFDESIDLDSICYSTYNT